MIVVDVNVVSFYLIDGDRTSDAFKLKQVDAEWMVPSFWSVEFQSVLWKYVSFGGMPMGTALELMDKAMVMFAPNEVRMSPDVVLKDALNWKITVYDAQYVSLARQYGVNCITEDEALRKACPGITQSMKAFIGDSGDFKGVREKQPEYRVRRRRKML